ncbi:MAG: hypothetical protein HXK70_04850 [Clostridiales bacterium]|nr:hypothetical protein [Clostridiales bacterium]
MVIMLLKLGINKKGINGDVDSYIFNEKFSGLDLEKMKKIASNFVENIPIEYDQIEIYSYDTNAISKLEFMEVVKAFINSKRKIEVYHMVYDTDSEQYIRHRIK